MILLALVALIEHEEVGGDSKVVDKPGVQLTITSWDYASYMVCSLNHMTTQRPVHLLFDANSYEFMLKIRGTFIIYFKWPAHPQFCYIYMKNYKALNRRM